jgi:(1->4)-alpha-D-glucan 1-alpha-D-glucosylmutase
MARAPLSTYRLQLNPAFTFDDAAEIVDYLADLGVSRTRLMGTTSSTPHDPARSSAVSRGTPG